MKCLRQIAERDRYATGCRREPLLTVAAALHRQLRHPDQPNASWIRPVPRQKAKQHLPLPPHQGRLEQIIVAVTVDHD
jgi:hypothetical protein